MKSKKNSQKQVKIITPPDSLDNTESNILVIDLTSDDQQLLLDRLLPVDIDVNIWSWNSSTGYDIAWLIAHSESVDQIIMRKSDENPLFDMLVSKTNSFYICDTALNTSSNAVNRVSNIKEVPIYGI